jgi:nicotinamide riboside kinase
MLMIPIAYGQTKLKITACPSLTSICSATQTIVTKVFQRYYNYCDPLLDKAAQEHEYDLFSLRILMCLGKKTI